MLALAGESQSAGELIAETRRRSGLTQAELARRASTSQSAIAAYESGTRQPTLPVLKRILAGAGFHVDVDVVPRPGLFRLADLAPLIHDESEEAVRLRLVFEFFDRAAEARDDEMLLLVAAEPSSCGDKRFDVMLAAIAEHLAVHAGIRVPSWALSHDLVLDGFWWVSDLPSARAYALVNAPASFRRRGILLDRHDLEAA